MILIEDSNNKVGKHRNIKAYCAKNNIEIVRKRLRVGDYMLGIRKESSIYPIGKISVDTKASVDELCSDVIKDYYGLHKKYKKCKEDGIKLVVLIEDGRYKNIEDLIHWKNRYGYTTGRELVNKLFKLYIMYGVEFMFCRRDQTGETIMDLLSLGSLEF